MVALNTVVNLWLSALKTAVPGANPRAYVDDVSVTAVQSSPEALVRDLTHAYEVSAHFVESSGMKLNKEKTFTFGSPHLENAICNTFAHLPEFRLVGGSFAVRHGHASATQLELQRLNKWSRTIQRSRHLPISWQDRCNALLRTHSQFTWGCGTHSMCNTKTHLDTLNGLRAGIMRCLLRRDQYVASPVAYFALVASPSLNPHFSRVVDGLVQFERALRLTQRRDAVVAAFSANAPPCSDGPVTRLRQVNAMPEFAGLVTPLLSRQNLNVERWLHTVREQWRQKQFEQLARNRPNFQGVQQNLLRDATLQYLKQLEVQGRSPPDQPVSQDQETARMRASVMRLLLTGGLFTQDVVTRHKFNQQTECSCAVGGQCTVQHISWACSHYSHLRERLVNLARRINRAKKCFKYAGILTQADAALATHIVLIHTVLVDIWQASIRKYLYADEPSSNIPPAPPQGEGQQPCRKRE